jgi:hypothetical protein
VKAVRRIAARAAAVLVLLTAPTAGADVIRIDGLSRAELGRLARTHDFWGIDPATGAAVFDVTPTQRARLAEAGYDVADDPAGQRRLDTWNQAAGIRLLTAQRDTIPGYPCYRTVARTHADLQALAKAHPERAEWIEIGATWQQGAGGAAGDSLFALRLADSGSPHPKPPLVVVATQHPRELVTAEVATRFAEHLLLDPGDDPDVAWLLDHRSVHIIAQANPDGRRQVEQGTAFWRKNHNETACSGGDLSTTWPGIDLNRNGSFLWSPVDVPCGQRYAGPVLASEPETRAVENYLAGVFARQRPAADLVTPAPDTAEGVLISLHSFGEMVLIPWEGLGGANENNAPNHDALTLLGRRFGDVTGYAVGRWSLLPPATGTLVDHAYGEYGAAAYTFELGETFFESCASFEDTVWPAALEALLLAARAARRPYLEPPGPALSGLQASVGDHGRWVVTGSAADDRYFSGGVAEPPQPEPIGDVVEIRLSPRVPPERSAVDYVFPVAAPATNVDFELDWPAGAPLPPNRRVFVTAIDSDGHAGMPRMVRLGETILVSGFESAVR